jgi:hypothetical protein
MCRSDAWMGRRWRRDPTPRRGRQVRGPVGQVSVRQRLIELEGTARSVVRNGFRIGGVESAGLIELEEALRRRPSGRQWRGSLQASCRADAPLATRGTAVGLRLFVRESGTTRLSLALRLAIRASANSRALFIGRPTTISLNAVQVSYGFVCACQIAPSVYVDANPKSDSWTRKKSQRL